MAEQPDRVQEMHRYLDEHAAYIRGLTSGTVQFDFGDGVKARITRVDKLGPGTVVDRLAATG